MSEEFEDKILSIKIFIADRPYPLKIKASEEERVRKAGKLLDEKVSMFKDSYAADKRDALAMAALMFSVDALKMQEQPQVSEDISDRLKGIEQILDSALNS